MSKIKLYIDYEKQERQCGDCREIFPFSNFTMNNSKTPKPDCKKCRSISEANRQINKAFDKYPHRYKYCDAAECLKIYSVTRIKCPECGETNER